MIDSVILAALKISNVLGCKTGVLNQFLKRITVEYRSRSLSNVSFFIHKVVRTPFYMCKYDGIYKIQLKETLNLYDKDFFRLRNKSIPAFTFTSGCLWPNDKDMNNKHYELWTQSYPRCELQ
jgi:hypothetical protein